MAVTSFASAINRRLGLQSTPLNPVQVPLQNVQYSAATASPYGSGGGPETGRFLTPNGQLGAQFDFGNANQLIRDAGGGSGGTTTPSAGAPQQPTTQAGSSFPFDAQYAEAMRNIEARRAAISSDEEISNRRAQEEYNRQNRDFGVAKDLAQRSLEARMADQGLIRSGINIDTQGKQGEEFARQESDLGKSYANTVEDIVRRITAARQDVTEQETGLNLQRARDVVQQQLAEAMARSQQAAQDQMNNTLNQINQNLVNQQQPQSSPSGTVAPAPSSFGSSLRTIANQEAQARFGSQQQPVTIRKFF